MIIISYLSLLDKSTIARFELRFHGRDADSLTHTVALLLYRNRLIRSYNCTFHKPILNCIFLFDNNSHPLLNGNCFLSHFQGVNLNILGLILNTVGRTSSYKRSNSSFVACFFLTTECRDFQAWLPFIANIAQFSFRLEIDCTHAQSKTRCQRSGYCVRIVAG